MSKGTINKIIYRNNNKNNNNNNNIKQNGYKRLELN